MPASIRKKKLLNFGFILTFLYGLQLAIPIYTLSHYLSMYFNNKSIAFIYMLAATISLYCIHMYNRMVKVYRNYNTSRIVILLSIISLILIPITNNIYVIGLYSIVYIVLTAILAISVNMYITEFSEHNGQGVVRGLTLSITSMSLISGLLISHYLLGIKATLPHIYTQYGILFIATALIHIPMLFIISNYYKHIGEPRYTSGDMWIVLTSLYRNRNLYGVFIAGLSTQIFVTTMIVYYVNYLVSYGHVLIEDYIGTLMPLALLPFLLIPYKVGMEVDRRHDEKKLMLIGLSIMGLSLLSIPIVAHYIDVSLISYIESINLLNIHNASISSDQLPIGTISSLSYINTHVYNQILIMWAIVLIIGRIGSSILETASTSYFYKTVSINDNDTIALFSNLGSVGAIIGAMIAIIAYSIDGLLGLNYSIFIISGIFLLYSTIYIHRIRGVH